MVRNIMSSGSSVHVVRARHPVWKQVQVSLRPKARGCHLVTNELRDSLDANLRDMEMGLAHLWIMHTSASLTVNENCDPSVRTDMESSLNRIVGSGHKLFTHMDEGDDDMPAHVKSSLMGAGLTIPISKGRLALGTWQGVWLNEHRDHGGSRQLMITLQGVSRDESRVPYGPDVGA